MSPATHVQKSSLGVKKKGGEGELTHNKLCPSPKGPPLPPPLESTWLEDANVYQEGPWSG